VVGAAKSAVDVAMETLRKGASWIALTKEEPPAGCNVSELTHFLSINTLFVIHLQIKLTRFPDLQQGMSIVMVCYLNQHLWQKSLE
jgi:hypothetical protein